MKTIGSGSSAAAPRAVLLVVGTAVLAVLATLGVLYAAGAFATQSRQEEVAEKGAEVMPFGLDATQHTFQKLDEGGLQTVTANDPDDAEQVSLVREHLSEIADEFGRGDFSGPRAAHGGDMPGLRELEAGAREIEFRYAELPDGARIKYTTGDPALVSALHRWFDAQVSDHGEHVSPGEEGQDHP